MKCDSIGLAAKLFHEFGNVGRDAEDLIKNVPEEYKLRAAAMRLHAEVEAAVRTIRDHHKMLE